MKTSSRIFFGFWGAAALLVLIFTAAAAAITRSWVAPDGRILRDASSLLGPWDDQALSVEAFSQIQLHGAFDVQWERADAPALVVSAPREKKNAFSAHVENGVLQLRSHFSGRFENLALRVKIRGPVLSSVTTDKNLRLRLSGFPGENLHVTGFGAVWMEGTCPPLNTLELRTHGMTVLRMKDCPVKNLELQTRGRVEIQADVTDRLEGSVHGDGAIRLERSPRQSRLATFGSVQVRTE